MNAQDLSAYVEFVADRLLVSLEQPPMYGTKNPFDFMEFISLTGKTNFFERPVADYHHGMSSDGEDGHNS